MIVAAAVVGSGVGSDQNNKSDMNPMICETPRLLDHYMALPELLNRREF